MPFREAIFHLTPITGVYELTSISDIMVQTGIPIHTYSRLYVEHWKILMLLQHDDMRNSRVSRPLKLAKFVFKVELHSANNAQRDIIIGRGLPPKVQVVVW